jgi:predicted AlkP superfamily pyrophosphatase or phosphodiesterase
MLRLRRDLRSLAGVAAVLPMLLGGQSRLPPPKLVVVIVIDQFRPDYLQRFRNYFGKGGFNLLLERGVSFAGARYLHGTTQTCPGHAVVLTGSYPNVSGIVANSWFDAAARKEEYCAADTLVRLIGVSSEGRSPRNLVDSTVGDELKRATGGRSRVITISGKDRASIMLGGHLADAAYWTEDTLVVSSTYYMKALPDWVRRFNASGAITSYAGKSWEHLLPAAAYAMVGPDNIPAEENAAGLGRTFPHRLSRNTRSGKRFINAFEVTPFHNDIVAEFAMQAVVNEGLGRDADPDLLGIGFSANDRIGHAYGPDSHEVMDATIRTDRLLERFFSFLAQQVGLENVLIVLTSDHGVAPLPELIRQRNPAAGAGRIDPATIAAVAENALRVRFGAPRRPAWFSRPTWISYQGWPSLYLNLPALRDREIGIDDAERVAKQALQDVPGMQQVFTAGELRQRQGSGPHSSAHLSFADYSFYGGRSGNIYYVLRPYVIPEAALAGTTHGSPWPYDVDVPLLWFGSGIQPGVYNAEASVADIAPTLSALLGVAPPSGSRGRILKEMLR